MGKSKNKGRGNQSQQSKPTVQLAPSTSNADTTKPIIHSKSEFTVDEESAKMIQDAIAAADKYSEQTKADADAYSDGKHDEADSYYSDKKEQADKLAEKEEERIQGAVDKAVKKVEHDTSETVREAEKKAKGIVLEAEGKASDQLKALKEQEELLDKKQEDYTRQLATLESEKISYKQSVLVSINESLAAVTAEKESLEKKISALETKIKKKDSEIASLEEDREFFEVQSKENAVRKSTLTSYELQIEQLEKDKAVLQAEYKIILAEKNKLQVQILQYGDDPARIIAQNTELLKKVSELESLITNCPSAEELEKLRKVQRDFDRIQAELEQEKATALKYEIENKELTVNKDEIEACRRFIKILELQKSELQRELDHNIELYNKNNEKIFATLSEIDSMQVNEYGPSGIKSLKELCDKFRCYLMNRPEKPLYYTEQAIRTFIAGFASSRLTILEGLSGTGKSSLPEAFKDFIGAECYVVPVQASWKDRNDLLGFYNDFKKQYKETEFLKALYTAAHDSDNIYIIVLDEMNLSRIEYYFADFASVLEKPEDDWKINLISDYQSVHGEWPKLIHRGQLQICGNTWFVGTANKDDSTFLITDKIYDRATVLNFDKKGEKKKTSTASSIRMSNSEFSRLLRNSSTKFAKEEDEKQYHAMINDLDSWIIKNFQITFGNRIAMQLDKFVPTYVACGGTVEDAVDIMFTRKVLRKLEGIYDENTKDSLGKLEEEILKKYSMTVTLDAIEKMIDKM